MIIYAISLSLTIASMLLTIKSIRTRKKIEELASKLYDDWCDCIIKLDKFDRTRDPKTGKFIKTAKNDNKDNL